MNRPANIMQKAYKMVLVMIGDIVCLTAIEGYIGTEGYKLEISDEHYKTSVLQTLQVI